MEAVHGFLQRFGYLMPGSVHGGTLDHVTAEAPMLYQRRNGLAVTGVLDEKTRQRMTTRRCAMPDPADRVGRPLLQSRLPCREILRQPRGWK